jgi:hypothetical protein
MLALQLQGQGRYHTRLDDMLTSELPTCYQVTDGKKCEFNDRQKDGNRFRFLGWRVGALCGVLSALLRDFQSLYEVIR